MPFKTEATQLEWVSWSLITEIPNMEMTRRLEMDKIEKSAFMW